MSGPIEIRPARPGDEEQLAFIQSESWRDAFRGIIPQDELEKRTEISRLRAMYEKTLLRQEQKGYLLLSGGEARAFSYWGPCRDSRFPTDGELICIHCLPTYRSQGLGGRLIEYILEDMRNSGYTKALLWVFEKNTRARAFYERHGFAFAGIDQTAFGDREMLYAKEL